VLALQRKNCLEWYLFVAMGRRLCTYLRSTWYYVNASLARKGWWVWMSGRNILAQGKRIGRWVLNSRALASHSLICWMIFPVELQSLLPQALRKKSCYNCKLMLTVLSVLNGQLNGVLFVDGLRIGTTIKLSFATDAK
jgi:hypothetical protein